MRGNSHVRFGEEPRGNDPSRAPRRAAYSTPGLHAQLAALPWRQVPAGASARDRGHGRAETRTLKAAHVSHLDFPHARQAIKITRWRQGWAVSTPSSSDFSAPPARRYLEPRKQRKTSQELKCQAATED
jgi:hypothetical protein